MHDLKEQAGVPLGGGTGKPVRKDIGDRTPPHIGGIEHDDANLGPAGVF